MTGKRGSAKKAASSSTRRPPPNTRAAAILPPSPSFPASVAAQTESWMADLESLDLEGPQMEEKDPPGMLGGRSTAAILAAIADSKSSVEGKIDTLAIECGLIRQDMDKFRGRLSEAEHRISVVEDTVASTAHSVGELQQQVRVLMARSEDAENRLRRNNVRVVGLPEGAEGANPVEFAETFFKELLGLRNLSPVYVVERAHRVPTGKRPVGAWPRAFLVRLLNFRDRDMILAEARKHPELKHENAAIHLYPDFSQELQKRRRSFTDVRRRLREKGLVYSMLYPSRLKVIHRGSAKFFDSPAEAVDWLDSMA